MNKVKIFFLICFLLQYPLIANQATQGVKASSKVTGNERQKKRVIQSRPQEEQSKGAINVIQRKIIQNKGKIELFPCFGMSLNDPYLQTFSFAVGLGFHFQENFYLELFGGISETIVEPATKDLQRESNLAPELSYYNYFADLNFVWIPISGKFSFFDTSILYFEMYLTAGGGYIDTSNSSTWSMNIGVGQKFYLANWLAFRFELKDHIYNELYDNIIVQGDQREKSKNLSHFLNVYLGISLFFP